MLILDTFFNNGQTNFVLQKTGDLNKFNNFCSFGLNSKVMNTSHPKPLDGLSSNLQKSLNLNLLPTAQRIELKFCGCATCNSQIVRHIFVLH